MSKKNIKTPKMTNEMKIKIGVIESLISLIGKELNEFKDKYGIDMFPVAVEDIKSQKR